MTDDYNDDYDDDDDDNDDNDRPIEQPTRFLELLEQLPPEQKERARGYLQHCIEREKMGRPHPLSILMYLNPEAAIKIAAGIKE